jgi:flagellin-specific chaperone FliS
MIGRMTLTICLLGSCAWCLAMVAGADSAQSESQSETFKPVASVDSLMHAQVKFFKAAKNAVDDKSMKERGHEIEEAAEVLAELANVNRYNSEKQDWRDWATQVRDRSLKLAREAEKKDADEEKISGLVKQIGESCGACHDKYQEE